MQLSPWIRLPVALATVALLALGCSSGSSGDDEDVHDSTLPNQPAAEAVAFNNAHGEMQRRMTQAAAVLSGPQGLQATAEALGALDVSTPEGRQTWATLDARFEEQLFELERALAAAALEAIEMADHEAAMQRMRIDALAEPVGDFAMQPKLISLATVFVVTTTAITLTRIYRNVRDHSHRNQNIPVRRVATTSAEGRDAVAQALRNRGVDVPPSATGEQIADIFETQGDRYLRAHVTQVARDFTQMEAGGDGPAAAAASENLEAQRQQNAQAARDGGVIAVDAVVNLSTAGPTGLGTAGEATMLVLTATEYTPNDIVNRHVDAVVASRETQPLETPPATLDPADARRRLRDAAEDRGDPPSPEDAQAFVDSIVAGLRDQAETFAPLTALPLRIAFGSTNLVPDPSGGGDRLQAQMVVPGFQDGDAAEILITRPDAVAQEVPSHPLGPASPLPLHHTPLLGTLSVSATPQGPAVDDVRTWTAEIEIRAVAQPTAIVIDGVNIVATPRIIQATSATSYLVSVDAWGSATLRARRLDSGESYLISLRGEDDQDQCPGVGTFSCANGDVICADLVCNGRSECGDGSDEDNAMCGNEDTCCIATRGCPSETGSTCGETCCCCPYGQICDPTNYRNGCVPE